MHWKRFYDIGAPRQDRAERIHQKAGVHSAGSGVWFWHSHIDGLASIRGRRWQGK